jgi:hypothetical protein
MRDLQQVANEAYKNSSGASAPPSRPVTLAASDKHVQVVARTTAARAQRLRNPRGTRYFQDAR